MGTLQSNETLYKYLIFEDKCTVHLHMLFSRVKQANIKSAKLHVCTAESFEVQQ